MTRFFLASAFVLLTACGSGSVTDTTGGPPTPLSIVSIFPNRVLGRDTGVVLTISGTGVAAGITVEVGGVAVTPLSVNGSTVRAIVPAAATQSAGLVDVVLNLSGAKSAAAKLDVIADVKFTSVSGRARDGCALSVDNDAYCWGDTFGVSSPKPYNIPAKLPGGVKFTTIGVNINEGCGLTSAGAVYCWPLPVNAGQARTPVLQAGLPALVSLSVGSAERCGVTAAGATWCWGSAAAQEITTVPAMTTVSSGNHQCGLTADGTAYCWGPTDVAGQLGAAPGTTQPVKVSTTLKFSSISAGVVHTCAVAIGGAGYCWGDNQYGELGAGDLAVHTGPTAVAGGRNFATSLAGYTMSCGIAVDKTAYCWGENTSGILGTVNTDLLKSPTTAIAWFKFLSLTEVAHEGTMCGVTDDNKLYCWGEPVGLTPVRFDPAM